MSYKLFTDKFNKFQCSIQVEGTSLQNSTARIILETNNLNYLFTGEIHNTGICEFELPKLKGILPEGTIGVVKLEVIADDVRFEPWSSEFVVEAERKVNVVVNEQIQEKNKPRIIMNDINLSMVEEKEPERVVENNKTKTTTNTDKTILTKKDILEILNRRNIKI
jgi:hypothetical protein